ncbi:MAG: ABC transporter permease [Lysobacterales bacterium]
MNAIFAIATKDLRLLLRNRATLFFTFVWPLLMAIGFGLMFGGEGERAKMRVLIDDQDRSAASQAFVAGLLALDSVSMERAERSAATAQVKRGRAVALIAIPAGFGAASERLFYGDPATVDVLIDPSRKAEIGMLEGLLMQVASQDMSRKMTQINQDSSWLQTARRDTADLDDDQRQRFDALFNALENLPQDAPADAAGNDATPAWQPLKVQTQSLQSDRRGPRNPFAITFPQGMLWGLVGCLMGFASGFAQEREKGTWLRLRTGPLGTRRLMAGKALAAMIALVVVQLVLLLLARLVFGLTVESLPALVLVVAASAVAFTGLMLLISSAGRTVQGVSSAGWAALMPMMMVGGGMIPLIAMPAWMATVSAFSPVSWSLRSLEGAIWRGYQWSDYLWPVTGMVLLGAVAFLLGARRLSRMID